MVVAVFPPHYLPGAKLSGGNEDNGDLLQKVPCTHCYTQCPPTLQPATTDPRLHWRLLDTPGQVWVSVLWVTAPFFWSWCTQGLFEPSEHLWWEWGLILNANFPLLASCRGFSFALADIAEHVNIC